MRNVRNGLDLRQELPSLALRVSMADPASKRWMDHRYTVPRAVLHSKTDVYARFRAKPLLPIIRGPRSCPPHGGVVPRELRPNHGGDSCATDSHGRSNWGGDHGHGDRDRARPAFDSCGFD